MTVQQTARAYVAAIESLSALGQLEHVRILARELLGHLEAAWGHGEVDPQETPYMAPEHPKNAGKHMVRSEAQTIVHRDVKPSKAPPKTPAERKRDQRARQRLAELSARAVGGQQLALGGVTPVTKCHAASVTNVTSNVTRDVTPSSSDLFSERPTKGLSAEEEISGISESARVTSRDDVTVTGVTSTRDVTPLELPESLPDELRAVFAKVLAERAGVAIDADGLWKKFRRRNAERPVHERVRSDIVLEKKWVFWCRSEEPDAETTPKPAQAETSESELDDAERSRRAEAERRARLARKEAEGRAAHERAWAGRQRELPEAKAREAARKAS